MASGGRIEGRRLAASDLPAPGGPIISRLWPPAAATSSAWRRCGWPRRSARSGPPAAALEPQRQRLPAAAAPTRRPTSAGSWPRLVERDHVDPRRQRRLGPVLGRHDDRLGPALARRLGDRQRPVDRPRRAVERQLADQRDPRQRLPLELAGGAQQRRGDRQVHPRPRLAQAGRGEVDDDPPQRELEAAVDQRRPHPLARLPHGGVGEADDREAGQAAVDVDLDPDRAGGDAVEGEGPGRGEHGDDATERGRDAWRAAVQESAATRGAQICARRDLACSSDDRSPAREPAQRAEELVARRLAAAGWEIVERNARTRYGELDIVALDGRALVFVEVKAGREGAAFGPERPILAVDPRKQRRVRRLATAWMAERRDAPPLRRDPLRRRRRHLRPRRPGRSTSSTSQRAF